MDREAFGRWIDAYERAWRTPGTDVLAELFTADAFEEWPFAPGQATAWPEPGG